MTETPIRRRPNGNIDTGFFMDRVRQLRSAELHAMAGATRRSLRRSLIVALATSGLVGASALAVTSAAAQAETEQVLQTELQGEEGREANIVKFDVEPGWETDRHIHPGHVFVYITEGSIEVDVEGKERQTYAAGEAFYELPDLPMVARTASADEGASFIVFQVGPTGEPIMVAHPD